MRRASDDAALLALGDQLHRAQRWIARPKPNIANHADAWKRWAASIDEALRLVAQISRTPASNLHGVSVKLDALIWLLTYDDAILDAGAEWQLRALAGR